MSLGSERWGVEGAERHSPCPIWPLRIVIEARACLPVSSSQALRDLLDLAVPPQPVAPAPRAIGQEVQGMAKRHSSRLISYRLPINEGRLPAGSAFAQSEKMRTWRVHRRFCALASDLA